ncbi:extracellular solute-binding protein [Paenibacillus sp. sgz302251]|uniref:extracellular solute-binding protein n=1 Tax=Paenibacillus sp. sgz302251 TaxID=3414493 RepID=UPI003C7E7A6E
MKRSIKLLTTLLIGATIVVSGCGNNSSAPSSGSGGNTGNSEAPQIKLTLTDSWTTTSTQAVDIVHRKLIEQFKSENPNVEISEDILDNASLKTKIKTLAAGNSLPDVFMLLGSDAKMLLENKRIMPLDDILAQDEEWKNGFIPAAFSDFMIDGQLTGAPMQMTSTSIVYYNANILKQAGYETFPATWDEFIDALKKIKELGYTPISMGNKDQWVAGSGLLSPLGDRFTGTEWFNSIRDKQGAKFTDPEFVGTLTAIKELSNLGAFNSDINSLDNSQQRTAYYNGKAAMFIEGGWAVSSLVTDAPKEVLDQTHLAVLPVVNGGKGEANATSGGSGWAIALNAELEGEKLEAALKLVKLLTGEQAANMKAELGDSSGTAATDYDKSKSSPLFEEYLQLLSSVEMTPVYDIQLSPEIIQTMNKGLQELLIPGDHKTPEKLAEEIQEAYENAL